MKKCDVLPLKSADPIMGRAPGLGAEAPEAWSGGPPGERHLVRVLEDTVSAGLGTWIPPDKPTPEFQKKNTFFTHEFMFIFSKFSSCAQHNAARA